MTGDGGAWLFWLERSEMVERISIRFATTSGVDVDDFRQDLMLALVLRHGVYDPSRTKPITWAWWQARSVQKKLVMQRKKYRVANVDDQSTIVDTRSDGWSGVRSIEARATIGMIAHLATGDEWDAANSRASGLTEDEIRESLGCAPFTARRRVAAFKERVGVGNV